MPGSGRQVGEDLVLPDAVDLKEADFSGRRFDYLSIGEGSRLVGCDFRRIRVTGGGLGGGKRPTVYQECVFDGARLQNVIPGRASFVSCSFRDVTITDLRCHSAEFVDCVFSGQLKTVIFNGRVTNPDPELGRSVNAFQGNDFREADLRDVEFRTGIDLDRQLLPDGPEYLLVREAAVVLEEAWKAANTWPPGDDRRDALVDLDGYWRTASRGQRDLLIRISDLDPNPDLAHRIAGLIRHAQEA
jgi:hypothetical protein